MPSEGTVATSEESVCVHERDVNGTKEDDFHFDIAESLGWDVPTILTDKYFSEFTIEVLTDDFTMYLLQNACCMELDDTVTLFLE